MKIAECFAAVAFDPYVIVLSVFALFLLWTLWKVHRSPKPIDLIDLVLGSDGKASWSKMAGIGGAIVGTWIVVFKTLHHELSTEDFLVYLAACIGSPVAFGIIGMKMGTPNVQMPQTTTTVQTDGATVKVDTTPKA